MRRTLRVLALGLLAAWPLVASGEEPDAKALATEILTKGSAQFDKKDAAAMAATYVEGAEISILSKKESEDGWKTETTHGRDEIERFYARMFDGQKDRKTTSRNVVEYSRFAGPDLLVIHGRFAPDVDAPGSYPFVQIRVKKDGQWRIQNLQLFLVSEG